MKQTKKAVSLLLVLVLLLGALSAGSVCFAAARGQCGPEMYWVLDDNGLLTISGKGRMTDASTWENCASAIRTVKFSCVPENIGAGSFEHCVNLKTIAIPDGVKTIGIQAFVGCTALESVDLPASVETIGSKAFGGCSALKSVTIPEKVKELPPYLFENCTALTSVTLPQGLSEIGFAVFRGCTALKDVYYGGTRAQWNAVQTEDDNAPLAAATVHCTDDNQVKRPIIGRIVAAIRRFFERILSLFKRR